MVILLYRTIRFYFVVFLIKTVKITLRLGYIIGSSTKHIIVRPSQWSRDKKLPPIGMDIYDEKARVIGRISDIIGPVFKPYFKIKPSRPNLSSSSFSSLVGEPLYTMPEPRGKDLGKKSLQKGRNMKDKRQYSNKFSQGKSSNSRNHPKSNQQKDKSPK
jgi:rRNA processing protein Gar1